MDVFEKSGAFLSILGFLVKERSDAYDKARIVLLYNSIAFILCSNHTTI